MKLLLDDKATRGYDLNANEACIFAAVLKCTRAGRGWYGNYRELAAAMPFVINRTTVYRAIQKLLTLGLIMERDNNTLYAVQIAQESVQNAQDSVQNAQESVQSALPPNNPPINNIKDKMTSDMKTDFEKFFDKFSAEYRNRFAATQLLWDHRSIAAQQAMWNEVKDEENFMVDKNPYFFVQNYREPQPEWKTGGEDEKDLVQVKYGDRFKICTRATMELFGLEWVRNW